MSFRQRGLEDVDVGLPTGKSDSWLKMHGLNEPQDTVKDTGDQECCKLHKALPRDVEDSCVENCKCPDMKLVCQSHLTLQIRCEKRKHWEGGSSGRVLTVYWRFRCMARYGLDMFEEIGNKWWKATEGVARYLLIVISDNLKGYQGKYSPVYVATGDGQNGTHRTCRSIQILEVSLEMNLGLYVVKVILWKRHVQDAEVLYHYYSGTLSTYSGV